MRKGLTSFWNELLQIPFREVFFETPIVKPRVFIFKSFWGFRVYPNLWEGLYKLVNPQVKRAGDLSPALVIFCAFLRRLKHVPQTELHQATGLRLTERDLRRRQLSESRRRRAAENKWIRIQAGPIEAGE